MIDQTATPAYLELCIRAVNDELNHIIQWSIRNGDKKLDEIGDIQERFNELAEELTK